MYTIATEYVVFLLELGTVAVVLVGASVAIAVNIGRSKDAGVGRLKVRKLNDRFRDLSDAISDAALPTKDRKRARKARTKAEKARSKQCGAARKRVFVLDFKGDMRASRVESLRHEVTAIIGAASDGDEVVARIDSPGGTVSGYGLAASQLERLREAGLRLTATVDKVAASGGYMMAVVADQIVCAPFAVVGSIGVVAGIPNIHRWLSKHDIDYELVTAGEHKRTLTVLGQNTPEGREKMRSDMRAIHDRFKALVKRFRPELDLDVVADGAWWLGGPALELGLVDELGTSDDVLLKHVEESDVFSVEWVTPKGLAARMSAGVALVVTGFFDAVARSQRHFP